MHLDKIRISGLEVDCVVGVYRHERDAPQRLRVDVCLELDTEAAGETGRISRTLDYQQVTAEIVFLLQSCRFTLIETAAHALARHLLAKPLADEVRPPVISVELCLAKPRALDGVAVPSLRVRRDASWARLVREERPFGSLDVIHDSPEVLVQRLNFAPGATARLSSPSTTDDAVMIIGKGLLCEQRSSSTGSIYRWPSGSWHSYKNPTEVTQSALLVRATAAFGTAAEDGEDNAAEVRQLRVKAST